MSNVAIITGSGGLVGSEAANFFLDKNYTVVGIDNNMRKEFFGQSGSTSWMIEKLDNNYDSYFHNNADIRNNKFVNDIFAEYNNNIKLIIHCAAQPSHDWASNNPTIDFAVNAVGTLNLLEAFRTHCPDAVFIFTSTNKVYGDTPNIFSYWEDEDRYYPVRDDLREGFDEMLSIDRSTHSVFGASKVAADIMVQEYGRYFGLKTACFRGGCLTGPNHSGVSLHGFLSYLIKCIVHKQEYTIFGYKGKQVRDNIHSADLINAFYEFYKDPRKGEVYNIGGGIYSNCSVLEAIQIGESLTGNKLSYTLSDENRIGDHKWWISDISKFKSHYSNWDITYSVKNIIEEMIEGVK